MEKDTLINVYEIPSFYGYKSIELHNADVCRFPFDIDCLAVSAFQDSYVPTPNTLIEELLNSFNIDCIELSKKPAIDLRAEFNVWCSEPVVENFNRLAFVELKRWGQNDIDYSEMIRNLFTLFVIMDQLGLKLETIALPVIGSGSQKIDPQIIIPLIIKHSIEGLEKISQLKTIYIVEISPEKIKLFDLVMNTHLNRVQMDINDISSNQYYHSILSELEINIGNLLAHKKSISLEELLVKLQTKNIRTFELAVLSRRICEGIIKDLVNHSSNEKVFNLSKQINSLYSKKISSWVISYFHTIRVFGNFYAHSNSTEYMFPSVHYKQDILVLVSSLNRVIIFYQEYFGSLKEE